MDLNEIDIINPMDDFRWDTFVENHPHGTIFQHSAWMTVIAKTYKQVIPLCFIARDEKKNIRSGLPCFIVKSFLTGKRMVSLPFTSFCDPLVFDDETLKNILNGVINQVCKISASFFELRTFKISQNISDERLKRHDYHKIHILETGEGFEKIRKKFNNDSTIRSVKKAYKSGVKIREGRSLDDLIKYYSIHSMTRKRLGFPIQPFRLFKNMLDIMSEKGYFVLLLAEYDKKAIGGGIFFKHKDTVYFEHGASVHEYLDFRPNHLVLWEAIERACAEGYDIFNFGKTPIDNRGLMEFKSRWGSKIVDAPYYYYPKIKGMMSLEQNGLKYTVLRHLARKLPLPFAKMMGIFAYRHLG